MSLRRIMLMQQIGGNGHNLPPEYQEVEYLESTGTQWIQFGWTTSGITQFTIICSGNAASGESSPFGNGRGYGGVIISGYNYVYMRTLNGYQFFATDIVLTERNEIICGISSKDPFLVVNGTHYTIANFKSDTVGENARLFYARYITGYGQRPYIGKIYELITAGQIQIDLIPCYRKADNKPGMYDIINDFFYTNDGTGEFIVGPDIMWGGCNYLEINELRECSFEERRAA